MLSDDYEKNLLSAVIVTYKQDFFLYQTIDSILNQTYPNIEIIISDDGSPDFSINQVQEYIDRNMGNNIKKRMVYKNEKNLGTVRNINIALSNSSGEYIKIIGGDDSYFSPEVFSFQVKQLESEPALFAVVGKSQQCNEKMEPVIDQRIEKSNLALPKVLQMNYDESRKYIYREKIFPISVQAVCFRRNFFKEFGLCDEEYFLIDDLPIILKLLRCSPNVGYTDIFCVNHRSNVGVSKSQELFAAKQLIYFRDCVLYSRNEICAYPNIYGKHSGRFNLRASMFAYEIALSKSKKSGVFSRLLIAFRFIDVVFFTIIRHSIRYINKRNIRRG